MSVGLIIVSVVILMIMFGFGQRVLDDLRLSDKEALVVLVVICIGLIIPPVWIGQYFCFSIGGFLIPCAISIYMLISCGLSRDLLRAILGTVIVAGVIYLLEWILPADPEDLLIDNMYIYGVVAGVVAYLLGRSRRNAFISCLFGIVLAESVQWIVNMCTGVPSILGLGIGGAFGVYVVSILISVAVSEFLGRCFESAKKDEDKKEFNFETHTYDSEKNVKIKSYTSEDVKTKSAVSVKNIAKTGKNNKKHKKISKESVL